MSRIDAGVTRAAEPVAEPWMAIPRGCRLQLRMVVPRYCGIAVAVVLSAATIPARADLQFSDPVTNAGTVYAGVPLIQVFHFKNVGTEAVSVIQARASCGCSKPTLGQSTYQPGETGSIRLEVYTLSQAPGPHTWTVTLNYQTGNEAREIRLELHARLVREVTVQPSALVVVADKIGQHELVVTDARPKAMAIRDAHTSSEKLLAWVSEPAREAQDVTAWRIRLAVTEDYPDGRHEEFVDLHTDDLRYSEIRVPVTVVKRVPTRVAATPSDVVLVAPAGQPLPSRLVLIRDEQGQPVHIDQVRSDDPAITAQWVPGPGAMATLRIRADRKLLSGETIRCAVHAQIDQPVQETVTISVLCTAH